MNELRKLMTENNLTSADVVRITGRKKNTVEAWLSVGQTRPIPKHMMKLLVAKCNQ